MNGDEVYQCPRCGALIPATDMAKINWTQYKCHKCKYNARLDEFRVVSCCNNYP